VDVYREITFRNSGQTYRGVPVMASNMDTVGTFEMATELSKVDVYREITFRNSGQTYRGVPVMASNMDTVDMYREITFRNSGQTYRGVPVMASNMDTVAASSGTADADFEKLTEILNNVKELKFVCLDVANGYSQHFVEYLRRVRAAYPTHTIIAGNVVTGEMVEELILSGADIIKLSAVLECADAAHGLKGHIISVSYMLYSVNKYYSFFDGVQPFQDGGCTCPGDVAKAFGAGADFVMAGGMFAGHDQCGGELLTTPEGKKVKLFYGMSSNTAMLKHSGGVADYRSSEGCGSCPGEPPSSAAAGRSTTASLKDILGGLRSACTYVGASRLRELPMRATFIRCCRQVNDSFSY
ncbi:GMP reductase, partial [Operophtera brumata]